MKTPPRQSRAANARSGFTLTEMLISVALVSVIFGNVAVALVASQRVYESTCAEVELSLQGRALREKLLFNINDEGGLKSISKTDAKLGKGNGNKSSELEFRPHKGRKTKLSVKRTNGKSKLDADLARSGWLTGGPVVFIATNVFAYTNGTIAVDLDLSLPVGNRTYTNRQQIAVQVMNP